MDDLTCHNLDAYIGGWLTQDERTEFEAHLKQCAACRDELGRQQRIDRLLSQASHHLQPPPADLIERVRQALEAARRRRRVVRVSAGLSAAAAILLAVLLTWPGREAPPTPRITAVPPQDRTATHVGAPSELSPVQQLAVWMSSRKASSTGAAEYPRPRVPVFAIAPHAVLASRTPGQLKQTTQTPEKKTSEDKESKVVRGTEPFNARANPWHRTLAERRLTARVLAAPLRPTNHETKLPDIHVKETRSCHLHTGTSSEHALCG